MKLKKWKNLITKGMIVPLKVLLKVPSVGPFVRPLVGHHGRRPLSVELRETSRTFAKVVTKGKTEGRKPHAEQTW